MAQSVSFFQSYPDFGSLTGIHRFSYLKSHSTLSIPFLTSHHATIAKRAISVDRELNQYLVERKIDVDGAVMEM